MNTLTKTKHVPANLTDTWSEIANMKAVEDWHPNVAKAVLLSDNETGIGASRRVEFHSGDKAVETVVELKTNEFVRMTMTEVPMIKDAKVTISVQPVADTSSEVTFSIDYKVGLGPIGWIINGLMMKKMMLQAFDSALEGLSYHLETGELVGDSVPN